MESCTINAPGKINLHLSVTGRRPDGYHLLSTLMVKLDLADVLTVTRAASGVRLFVRGADLSEGDDNLVVRAARMFFQAADISGGAEFHLEKNIPVAAGMGGGSSDAAAALEGLNRLYSEPLSRDRLAELGLSLGADVPFFIHPGASARAEGIGEILTPGPILPEVYFLLLNPGWPLSTAWVFKNYNLKLTKHGRNHIYLDFNERSFTIGSVLHNDLEAVVLPRYPELSRMKERLIQAGATGALMTGSGPTVFGVFRHMAERDRAASCLRLEESERWRAFSAQPLSV